MSLGSAEGTVTIGGLKFEYSTSTVDKLEQLPAKVAAAVENKLTLLTGAKEINSQLKGALQQIEKLKTDLAKASTAPAAAAAPAPAGPGMEMLRQENAALREDVAQMASELAELRAAQMNAAEMADGSPEEEPGQAEAPRRRGRPRKNS